MVALAAAVGIRSYLGQGAVDHAVVAHLPLAAVAIIEGPQREEANGTAVVDVQIGPAASYASAHFAADDLDSSDRAPVVFALPVRVFEDAAPGIFE